MKYVTPEYSNEIMATSDIMGASKENIVVESTNGTFDFGDGQGSVDVSVGVATTTLKDLLFG